MSENEWEKEIIQTEAALVKAEIGEIIEDRNFYSDISTIGDIEK